MQKSAIVFRHFSFFLLAVSAALMFSASVSLAQDDADDGETIKIETNLIVLNAVVTDAKGNHVPNLKLADFKVFDNGVEQDLSSAELSAEQTPFAAVVLLDTSGSMESRLSLGRAAAIRFLDGLRGEDVAAVYNFDSKVKSVQEFSASRDLSPMAYDLKADGKTALNDAVAQAAKDLSARPEKRRAIIVLSDGADTFSRASRSKALRDALAVNATIYTVDMSSLDVSGLTNDARKEHIQSVGALKEFAEKSGGRFVPVAGGKDLRDAFAQIVAEIGLQYTIGYQPKTLASDGKWHTLEVKLKNPAHTVRARKGYNAPKKVKN